MNAHKDLGIVYNKIPEPTYGNYDTICSSVAHISPTHLTKMLYYAATNAIEFIENNGKTKIQCTMDDAINVHKVFNQLGIQ